LPDFVYFNHSIHINKGVGCTTCHGRVDEQPITWRAENMEMAWCLNCHRQPESYLRPRQAVFLTNYKPPSDQAALGKRLLKEYHVQKLQDCYTCHR
jgi:NAD-dependent SIR2 family protein deacetylase